MLTFDLKKKQFNIMQKEFVMLKDCNFIGAFAL